MTVILIDGKNALFRFGYAHKLLRTTEGVPTGAIYGVLGCLLRLKKRYPAAKFVVVWDGPGKSWRHKFWAGYKANRHAPDETKSRILAQIPALTEITGMMGIKHVVLDGVEADDLLGILALRCVELRWQSIIYSSDKDFIQLMDRGVQLIRDVDKSDKLAVETNKSVFAMFGCHPVDVLWVRAIAGDTSDGFKPVVRLLGPKKAAKLVAAGLDPVPAQLRSVWGDVERNVRLMRVGDTLEFDAKNRTIIQRAIDDITRGLRASSDHYCDDLHYASFLRLLSSLQLVEAVENRHRLWRIQE
jgi:DNA polymerase-1